MKTKLTMIIFIATATVAVNAQDVIKFKNGSEINAKVIELSPSEVKYKKFANENGPSYTELKSNIFMIRYENGEKDVFSNSAPEDASNEPANIPAVDPSKEDPKPQSYMSEPSIFPNYDLIVKSNGDSIHCVIDMVTTTFISYHILRHGSDTRSSVPRTMVANYFVADKKEKTEVVVIPKTVMSETADDDDEIIQDVRKYSGPRIGVTFVADGAYKSLLESNANRPTFSQFGWQFERRLFTTETGISAMVEFIPLIGGLDMGKFIPSLTGIMGVRIKNGIEIGAGPNVGVYSWKDERGDSHTLTSVGVVFAAGFSYKSGKVNFPINVAFTPSFGKKGTTQDPATGKQVSYRYQTGAKLSLLVGFNYRKR